MPPKKVPASFLIVPPKGFAVSMVRDLAEGLTYLADRISLMSDKEYEPYRRQLSLAITEWMSPPAPAKSNSKTATKPTQPTKPTKPRKTRA